jgi:OOP family OmpA-OmpF porin
VRHYFLSAVAFDKKISCPALCSVLLVFVVFYSLPAPAASAANANFRTYLLGAKLGYSYNHHSCVDMAVECDREDAGYGFFAGYNFKNHFSLELSGTKLGDTHVIYPNVTLRGKLSTVDLSVKYTRNLHKNVDAFGKLGVAYWDGEILGWENAILKDSGERPVVGGGIQFPLSPHVDGRLEYQYFDQLGNHWMGYTDAHFMSFSLVWNFSTTRK